MIGRRITGNAGYFPFSFFVENRVAQYPDLFDLNFYKITLLQILRRTHGHSHALWCPGQNHRTWVEGSTPAQKLDQSRNIKEHVRCIRTLTSLAIDSGFDTKRI